MELTTNQGMLSQLVHCVRSIISSDLDLGLLAVYLDSERLLGIKPIMVDGSRLELRFWHRLERGKSGQLKA